MRTAIMGAGSLGTILGAYISKSGKKVDLIDASKEHVDALNQSGAHVTGTVNFTVPVHAIMPEQMDGVYDVIIFMAKQTYNNTTIPQIKEHIAEDGTVCVCQNGIPEYAVSKAIGKERVVGAPVGWGATFQGPGCSELTTKEDHLSFTLGSVEGKVNRHVEIVKDYLECMGTVSVSENLMGLRWSKLLMNSTFSGLSTALGTTFGGVLDNPEAMKLILQIGRECIRVTDQKGIKLEPYETYDFYEAFGEGDDQTDRKDIELIREIWLPHYNLTASMAQDIKKGKLCEIYDINGVVCRSGKECGVPTPVNDRVVEIVSGMQDGIYPYSPENIKYFYEFIR